MASSKLYHHLTSSFHLLHRHGGSSSSSSSSRKPTLSLIPSSSFRLPRPLHYSCLSTAADTEPAVSSSAAASDEPTLSHPWPEWAEFLDKMKTKGYFVRTTDTNDRGGVNGGDEGEIDAGAFMDQNRVKNACLKFARERFDILRSLPREEIQTVVECGCPNLFRKAVNSAKKLRAFLKLDEGDVCSACILRGSCDRAYVTAKEDEGARTVDVMRILMSYAVDPVLYSGGDNPSVKEHVHESARKLLAELTKLSDTTIDPELSSPAVQQHSSKNEPSQKSQKPQKATIRNNTSRDVEMKRGDWLCSNCNFLNFARNLRCLECKEDGPKRVNPASTEMKLGDWNCPQCKFMNFARNKKCFRCQEARPKKQLNPGEWECSSCDYLNFRGNKVCKKCNRDGPKDILSSQYDDHEWISPRNVKGNKASAFGDDTFDKDDFNDDEDDILPLHKRENNLVARKRTKPAERRLDSAREATSPWL